MIKFFNVDRQYQQDREEYLDLADRVFSSGQVINGKYCRQLENSLKSRTGRKHCILTASCTDALAFVGSAVLTANRNTVLFPNLSFPATDNGFVRETIKKSKKIYLNTDSRGNIDLNQLEKFLDTTDNVNKITVVWVNLFGHTINYDRVLEIKQKYPDVTFVEDAAQSIGAAWKNTPSGGMGDASCISFDPTKNLNAFGLGGAVLTDRNDIAEWVDLHRRPHTSKWQNHGYNSQINELDAAIVWWKLENRFDQWQARRKKIAEYYIKNTNVDCVVPDTHCISAWHKFVINYHDRDNLAKALFDLGIETKTHYPKTLSGHQTDFTRSCLSLPIYPELNDSEVEHIVNSVNQSAKLFS
jgi:dTDP-4-amino-4,6-dideoxygalactose transaminase